PAGRAALPGDQRQRPQQDHPHQRRRGPARVRVVRGGRPVPGRGRRRRGARIIVLSDRCAGAAPAAPPALAPIPSLLLTAAVHHHLIRERTRTQAGLIVESGDARECHHIALLVGYGGAAVNPYVALETVQDMVRRGVLEGVTARKAAENLIKALGKGLLKIMSKM